MRGRLPSIGTILAWLGVIGTLLGILGFFISDLPSLLGGNQGLSDQDIVATLAALQDGKEQAELQLTQIAVVNAQSANQMTQQALNQQVADFQATLDAAQAKQDEFVATQNAISAMTATVEAINATATQVSLDAAATQAALAQIVPTDTPMPTATEVPPPVADYRSLLGANVDPIAGGQIQFLVQAVAPIPDPPPSDLAYVWLLDTDQDPATGQQVQDIGADKRVSVRVDSGIWVGTVRSVKQDGTLGEPLLFVDITVDGAAVTANLDPSQVGLPAAFDWVVRTEVGGQSFSLWPTIGHDTFFIP
jgi:hypothetical protein